MLPPVEACLYFLLPMSLLSDDDHGRYKVRKIRNRLNTLFKALAAQRIDGQGKQDSDDGFYDQPVQRDAQRVEDQR